MGMQTLEALRIEFEPESDIGARVAPMTFGEQYGSAADVESGPLSFALGFDEEDGGADGYHMAGTGKILTAKCQDCGLLKRGFYWEPGMACPGCGSKSGFLPLVTGDWQGAPDRTGGPAAFDLMFARIVRWAGLVDEKRLNRCLRKQQRLAEAHYVVPGIDEILVRRSLLSEEHVEAVMDVLSFHELRAGLFWDQERQFLAAALRRGWLDNSSARQLAHQYKTAVRGKHPSILLGCFAVDRGFLTDEQVCAIYREECAQGRGLLHEVKDALRSRGIPESEAKPREPYWWVKPMAMAAAAMVALFIS